MKASDRQLIKNADIVICSYLPDGREDAGERAMMHFKQLEILRKQFPDLSIVTIASNYPVGIEHSADEDVVYVRRRLFKAEMHNIVIKQLMKDSREKAVLILGDDVVPAKMEGLKTNPVSTLKRWLMDPSMMPAECLFFSCKGTLRDTYYKARAEKGVRFSPTAAVTDWAIMVRNDFGVLMNHDLDNPDNDEMIVYRGPNHNLWQLNSDAMLRFKAASMGVECLKDQELFFETFQSTSSDKNSVWYKNRDERKRGVKITDAFIRKRWPWLFKYDKNGKVTSPIWMARGKERQKLIDLGFLVETKYGCIPNGSALHRHYEKKQIQSNSLVDLL